MAEMSMVERVANAMEEAEFGYSMNLVRLVDGVSTYRLSYSDREVLEFDNTDDLYLHVAAKKRRTQARAAIEAMRKPTQRMRAAGQGYSKPDLTYTAMINAALSEEVPG